MLDKYETSVTVTDTIFFCKQKVCKFFFIGDSRRLYLFIHLSWNSSANNSDSQITIKQTLFHIPIQSPNPWKKRGKKNKQEKEINQW